MTWLGLACNVIILFILKITTIDQNFAYLVKFNQLMILFNIMPIFPLDGYRFLNDLLHLDKKPYLEEIILTLGIGLLLILLIIFLLFKFYGLIIVLIYLIYLNLHKIKKNKNLTALYYQQMMYEMSIYKAK